MIEDEDGNFSYNHTFDNGRVLTTYETSIYNSGDILYYGNLYFGSSSSGQATLQFIFDTGSSWLWAGVSGCSGCLSSQTLGSSYYSSTGTSKNVTYGTGSISGMVATTAVAPTSGDSASMIPSMKMIAVDSVANIPGNSGTVWDGIVGLLPTTSSGSDLFVKKLYNQGIISSKTFGFHYTTSSTGNEVIFGGWDTDIVPSIDDFTFTSLSKTYYWMTNFRRSKYGDTVFGGSATQALLDSGTSLLLFPTDDYNAWYSMLSSTKTCVTYNGYPA